MNRTVGITLIGIIIFGGTDPITKIDGYFNAFREAFGEEKCLEDRAKVGRCAFDNEMSGKRTKFDTKLT